MIDYLFYLFMRYTPILISASSAAFILIVSYGNHSIEEIKSLLIDSLVVSTTGWALLFVAHEDVRKILYAVECHLKSINESLNKAEDTKTD